MVQERGPALLVLAKKTQVKKYFLKYQGLFSGGGVNSKELGIKAYFNKRSGEFSNIKKV